MGADVSPAIIRVEAAGLDNGGAQVGGVIDEDVGAAINDRSGTDPRRSATTGSTAMASIMTIPKVRPSN